MKKSRRKNKQSKQKKRNRTSRGGALKHALVTGLAALSQGYNTATYNQSGLVTYSGEPSSRLASVYESYVPVNHSAKLLPYISNTKWNFSSKNIGGPIANAKDINGNPVSQEEAVKRIAEWHSQVEEEQKDHAANPDNICSVQGGASSMCSGSIGIPRSLMPQIKRVNRQAFFDFLKAWTGNENLVHDEELDIESLTPTQSELMQPLIQKQINRATKNGTTPPTVIVTRDPTTGAYTLYDGHHRWAAMYQQYLESGTGGKIKTTVIDLPIMYTLELSSAFGAPHALTDV